MAAHPKNEGFVVSSQLVGEISEKNFAVQEIPYPTLPAQGIVAEAQFLSVDPYLRIVFSEAGHVGKVIENYVVGKVVESSDPQFPVGSFVTEIVPMQKYFAVDTATNKKLRLISSQAAQQVPLSHFVGVLGMPGATVFGGIEVLDIQKGDTVLVSGAAGAVGSLVGQMARLLGAGRVIGVAGGDEKCRLVVEQFGFDACVDYKSIDTSAPLEKQIEEMGAKLKEAAQGKGIDCYYDNTGGVTTDAVWDVINQKGRVAVCGQIAHYNDTGMQLIRNPFPVVNFKALTIKGVIVFSFMYEPGFIEKFEKSILEWIKDKKLNVKETLLDGFHNLPTAMVGLFKGTNVGKMVVKA